MSVEGTWDLANSTPIGKINAVVDLHTRDGSLGGTAHGHGEDITLRNLAITGDRLTWTQSITKPIRLNLTFVMTIDGDTMTGTSKAGRLPASTVIGRRRSARGEDPSPCGRRPGPAPASESDATGA